MNTENKAGAIVTGTAIDNTPGGMEGMFQEFLEEHHPLLVQGDNEVELMQEAFYRGAQALLDAANPLSRLAALQVEIDEYLNPSEEVDLG